MRQIFHENGGLVGVQVQADDASLDKLCVKELSLVQGDAVGPAREGVIQGDNAATLLHEAGLGNLAAAAAVAAVVAAAVAAAAAAVAAAVAAAEILCILKQARQIQPFHPSNVITLCLAPLLRLI